MGHNNNNQDQDARPNVSMNDIYKCSSKRLKNYWLDSWIDDYIHNKDEDTGLSTFFYNNEQTLSYVNFSQFIWCKRTQTRI